MRRPERLKEFSRVFCKERKESMMHQNMRRAGWLAGIGIVLMLSACGGRKATTGGTGGATGGTLATPPPASAQTSPLDGSGASGAGGVNGGTVAGMPATRVIYFDFDSSDIKSEFTQTVAEHARYLSRNASIRVRLEGNTDERGSREYNVGLGERRAQSVRRALLLQGVAESQVTTVSYGEEKPAVAGSTEEAYAKNRRVELAYQN
jgi:peptidoglycan-associated lipoprotein